jgi:hypothetical protein
MVATDTKDSFPLRREIEREREGGRERERKKESEREREREREKMENKDKKRRIYFSTAAMQVFVCVSTDCCVTLSSYDMII